MIVALSGGVDSSVAALILKKQGYHVIGIFMKNWHDESVTISNECPWLEDSNDALIISEKLGIPFQVIDLSKEYKKRIVDYMFREYKEEELLTLIFSVIKKSNLMFFFQKLNHLVQITLQQATIVEKRIKKGKQKNL